MAERKNEKDEIILLLKRLQKGYLARDVSAVKDFVEELFIEDEEVLIIGTSAVTFEDQEWCEGLEKVTRIFESDWKYWGDLQLNVEEAHITFEDNMAYVAMTGIVSENIQSENYYQYRLELIGKAVKDDNKASRSKLIEIIRGAADTLFETEKGENYAWPIRLTILIVKRNNQWKFKTMHFSYPVTFYPPVRL